MGKDKEWEDLMKFHSVWEDPSHCLPFIFGTLEVRKIRWVGLSSFLVVAGKGALRILYISGGTFNLGGQHIFLTVKTSKLNILNSS